MRTAIKSSSLIAIIVFVFILSSINSNAADDLQRFSRTFAVGGRVQSSIILIGLAKDNGQINRLFNIIIERANDLSERISIDGKRSEIRAINEIASIKAVPVSADILAAVEGAIEASRATGGTFELVAERGIYSDIRINRGGVSIEFMKPGMKIDLTPLHDGIIADAIISDLRGAAMHNALVNVGDSFMGIGADIGGPWSVQIEDQFGTYAHHAADIPIKNAGVSIISGSSPKMMPYIRKSDMVGANVRGTTIIAFDATVASGIALATFKLGADGGLKLLNRISNARGIIVDGEGKFLRSGGLR